MLLNLVKAAVKTAFNTLGYTVPVRKAGPTSIIQIDRNTWEPFYQPNLYMQKYYEGLKKSNMEWSDNFYKQLRYYSLIQMVQHVVKKKISGDFVECGVWKGHSAYMLSKVLSENQFTGTFHIFDSFEGGLSEKVGEDKNLRYSLSQEQIKKESEVFSSTEEDVKSCLREFPFICLYKGWIPNRFNEVENRQFAFVHLDVDLYTPTIDSLNFFFMRLAKHGVIVVDDYGSTQFPGIKKSVDEFLGNNEHYMFYEVPMGACYIIK